MFHDADLPELTLQLANEEFRRELADVIDLVENSPEDTDEQQ